MTVTRSAPKPDVADPRAPGPPSPAPARAVAANAWPGAPGALPSHCPLCFGTLEPMPGMPGRARHRSARCSAQCVLTTRQYQPDEMAVRGGRDARVAARHRERFVANWERHYALVRRMWPAFTIARFTAVLACADVHDLWSYPSLRDDDLASVLLVLAGFMRTPGAHEPATGDPAPAGVSARWVRFWFDASVRDAGDLWTAGADAPRFFRVDYREPQATPFPTGAQVLGWQQIGGVRDAWAQQQGAPVPAVEAAERAAFARFVARSKRRDAI
ncbi:hypothetical protein [Burkholderia ubonensis]|uniref:Uncharacterized protein n=1 Tax=Burkholderia ubonensis subsp. mesacidophila TaxID=265293 RepID=A0A2A4FJQ9_9BURK|nr:hypothetical protein [Burkholderia ubonensis]PCE32636.1 hypothetical protein BZL54_09555 [Burkholderia ubonensis subsp. mesacidophila]